MKVFRKKTDNGFEIVDGKGTRVSDVKILKYVESLVIPPAYNPVVIFVEKNPKILYEGIDSKGRKQQIYSKQWIKKTTKQKFHMLIEFGQLLPKINQDIDKYLRLKSMNFHKCVAVILRVISVCYFRVGNLKYEKLYGSHGISTLKKKHLTFKGNKLHIEFIGKKAQLNTCDFDGELVEILREIADTKSMDDFLFTFRENGETNLITAIEINNFLKEYNKNFTTKMFRTFDTNTMLIDFLKTKGDPTKLTLTQRKKNIVEAMTVISQMVNNTPAICRKSYANANLIEMYIENPMTFRKKFFLKQTSRQLFIDYLISES
jgi:DNA topoisomerase I